MATITIQPDSSTGVDTFIDSYTPNSADGGDIVLPSGKWGTEIQRSLIKFDLSSIGRVSAVISATLTLTISSASGATVASTVSVFRQYRAWSKTLATWNIYTTGSNWASAGGFGAADCEQSAIGTVTPSANPAGGTAYNISLSTSAIKDMINGIFTNNGFFVKNNTEGGNDRYLWASSRHSTASYRPKLVIDYLLPSGVTAVFLSDFGVM